MVCHGGSWFGTEILDDDLLDVPVPFVEIPYCQERFFPVRHCFTDSQKKTGSEGYSEFSGILNHAKPYLRLFAF